MEALTTVLAGVPDWLQNFALPVAIFIVEDVYKSLRV